MKFAILVVSMIIISTPAFGLYYPDELANGGESSSLMANVTYNSAKYMVYSLSLNGDFKVLVIQDSFGGIVKDNETFVGAAFAYRIDTMGRNETVPNPKLLSEGDLETFSSRIKEKASIFESKSLTADSEIARYGKIIDSLISEGAYSYKSEHMLTEMKSSLSAARSMALKSLYNSAIKLLDNTTSLGPMIEADASASLALKEAMIMLEESNSTLSNYSSYDISAAKEYYSNAALLLKQAEEDYDNGDYGSMNSKILSARELSGMILTNVQSQKEEIEQNPITGWAIRSLSALPYAIGILAVAAAAFFVYKKRTQKITYEYY